MSDSQNNLTRATICRLLTNEMHSYKRNLSRLEQSKNLQAAALEAKICEGISHALMVLELEMARK